MTKSQVIHLLYSLCKFIVSYFSHGKSLHLDLNINDSVLTVKEVE